MACAPKSATRTNRRRPNKKCCSHRLYRMSVIMAQLSEDQRERYERNILLPGLGAEGQQKLLSSRVLVVGTGGLGSPAILYLAAAGVGTIGIVDNDKVELSNLQRQIIHTANDIGRPKTESSSEKLKHLNPDIKIT